MHHYKGSEWNKWDLHIHTLNLVWQISLGMIGTNMFLSLLKVLLQTIFAVIGITDYFTIDGYKKLLTDYLSNDQKMKSLFTPAEISAIKILQFFLI